MWKVRDYKRTRVFGVSINKSECKSKREANNNNNNIKEDNTKKKPSTRKYKKKKRQTLLKTHANKKKPYSNFLYQAATYLNEGIQQLLLPLILFLSTQHNFIVARETSPIIFLSLFISYLNIPTYKNLAHINISYISIIVVYSSTIIVLFSINAPLVKLRTNPPVET